MISDVYVCEISCCVVLSIEICTRTTTSTNISRIDGICLCNVVVGIKDVVFRNAQVRAF